METALQRFFDLPCRIQCKTILAGSKF